MLMEHQFDGSPQSGVSVETAGLMLGQPPFQSNGRRPDIVRAVGAAEDIEVGAHIDVAFFETPLRGLLRMTETQLTLASFCRLLRPGGMGSPLARTRRPQLVNETSPT